MSQPSVEGPGLRLFCFDLDGCLIVSDAAIADAINHALAEVGGRQRSVDDLRRCIGPPLVTNMTRLLQEDGVDVGSDEGEALVAHAVSAYRSRYVAVGYGLTTAVEGVAAMLGQVAALATELSAELVVVTTKPTIMAEPLLTQVGLRQHFVRVHGTPMGEVVEEKTVTLARALAEAGLERPSAAVMIGDREHDVLAGHACRTRSVGVLWGAGPRDELVAAGPDVLVEQPAQLPAELRTLSRGPSAGR